MITGHGSPSRPLALQAGDGGLLTDGMGTGGHDPTVTGQGYAVVQARSYTRLQSAHVMAQVDLRALWLSQGNNVRVTVDGGPETVLQGTVLPQQGGRRRFRSKPGGKIEVLLVTDIATSLSFVSLAVSEVYDCKVKPLRVDYPGGQGNSTGCPGAMWMDGSPSPDYCYGYRQDASTNMTRTEEFPWWAACCRWTNSTCAPLCTDLDVRVATTSNKCCDDACVCRRNVTSDPCV